MMADPIGRVIISYPQDDLTDAVNRLLTGLGSDRQHYQCQCNALLLILADLQSEIIRNLTISHGI